MEIFLHSAAWISLLTLTFMEIVLGIDNVVFISIVAGKLPKVDQQRARTIGMLMALFFRILLLLSIKWIVGLKEPIFTIFDLAISYRDLILIGGGLFLLWKSVTEMHHKLEGVEDEGKEPKVRSFSGVIFQIIVIDIVFSFDSILTAVGLADDVLIMILAVVISLGIMLAFSGKISDFINDRPTMKMLALSFLLMIGFLLVLEGLHQHIEKGYIYFAMAFSFVVELLNIRLLKKNKPVDLRDYIVEDPQNTSDIGKD